MVVGDLIVVLRGSAKILDLLMSTFGKLLGIHKIVNGDCTFLDSFDFTF